MIEVIATKVIQINSECGFGSTGKISVAISRELNKNNVENYIFYSGNHKNDYEGGIMIAPKISIRIHQLLSRVFGDQGFHSYFSTRRMVKKIKKIAPDAILLHNLHGYYLHMGVLFRFLKRYGKPVYWTFHDCWPFTGHCTHFIASECYKWKDGCYECPRKSSYPYSWFFDRSKDLYKKKKKLFTSIENMTVITPSEWLAELVRESYFNKYPIKVINNGIDLDVFKPTDSVFRKKYAIGQKRIVLGVSSVWNYYKGIDVFCELFQRLDTSKYQIVLVGTDDSVDKMLPEGIISVHRTCDQTELAALYTCADVFVNPTREENYPTVNMEAIACGTPVVTFNTGGCAEIVTEECGAVVYSNTIDEMVEKIHNVISNRDFYVNGCRSRADDFAERTCFDKYIRMIIG